MYRLLLIVVILLPIFGNAQSKKLNITDSTFIIAIVNKDVDVYKLDKSSYLSTTIYQGARVLVIGVIPGDENEPKQFEVIYRTIRYKMPSNAISSVYTNLYDDLSKAPIEQILKIDSNSIKLADAAKDYEIDEAIKYVNKFKSKGLMVINYSIYDESEYTSGTSFQIKVLNLSKKTIKYITFNLTGKNAVKDAVSTKSRKGIGPIEPNNTASYEFDYVWFTDIVQYVKINSITIQYMDGTTKTLTGIESIVMSDLVEDVLFSE